MSERALSGREKSIPSSVIKTCEYFPCHKTNDPDNFNCLFCYCPLYALGDACGGNFRFTEKGIKDCTNCLLPHVRKNYGYVTGKYSEIMEVAGKNRKENRELIQKTAEELKTLTEESLTEASDENQKERLEKIQKLTRETPARERSRKIKRNGE